MPLEPPGVQQWVGAHSDATKGRTSPVLGDFGPFRAVEGAAGAGPGGIRSSAPSGGDPRGKSASGMVASFPGAGGHGAQPPSPFLWGGGSSMAACTPSLSRLNPPTHTHPLPDLPTQQHAPRWGECRTQHGPCKDEGAASQEKVGQSLGMVRRGSGRGLGISRWGCSKTSSRLRQSSSPVAAAMWSGS